MPLPLTRSPLAPFSAPTLPRSAHDDRRELGGVLAKFSYFARLVTVGQFMKQKQNMPQCGLALRLPFVKRHRHGSDACIDQVLYLLQ